jgi:uncharacterized protein (DUF58 family)
LRFGGAYALFVMAIIILVIGFSTRNWELISLVIPISLYLLVASLLRPPSDISVVAERAVDLNRVMEGDTVEVELKVENGGTRSRHIEIQDKIPGNSTLIGGSNRHPIGLGPGQKATFRYTLRLDRRGKPRIGPTIVRWRDPLFVFQEEKFLDVENELTVIPYVHEIGRKTLSPERLRMPVGSTRSRFRGLGTDFHSIREYFPGDEFKRVNWKASARMNRLLVNDFESERSGDVTVILDATGEDETEPGRQAMDRAMEAAVSISSNVLRNRHRVGMIIVGEYIDTVMPAYGRRQFYRIVDHVLSVESGEMRSLWNTLTSLEGRFPFESTLIVVSPLTGRGVTEGVKKLVAKGHSLAIVSPSPIEIEKNNLHQSPSLDLAYRIWRVRRSNQVSELRRYCKVYDWNTYEPLEKYLREVRRSGTGRPSA